MGTSNSRWEQHTTQTDARTFSYETHHHRQSLSASATSVSVARYNDYFDTNNDCEWIAEQPFVYSVGIDDDMHCYVDFWHYRRRCVCVRDSTDEWKMFAFQRLIFHSVAMQVHECHAFSECEYSHRKIDKDVTWMHWVVFHRKPRASNYSHEWFRNTWCAGYMNILKIVRSTFSTNRALNAPCIHMQRVNKE